MAAVDFYHTKAWKRVRALVLRRDHYKDFWRARFGVHEPAETVHHVFLLDDRPDLALDPRNLVSVSRHTHAYILHKPDGSLTEAGEKLKQVIIRNYPELATPAGAAGERRLAQANAEDREKLPPRHICK